MKQVGAVLLAVLLTFGLTRWLWPRTETVRLPGSTDTVTVTQERLDTVWRERTRWRETVTTDTVVLADTVWQTEVDTVASLSPRWYLDSATIATDRGDTSYYALTWLSADSAALQRADRVERHVTLGPVRQIATDSAGLHVDYGEFPERGGWGFLGFRLPGWVPVAVGAAGGVAACGALR